MTMQLFARMTKVDEATRTVTGVIANEALDRSGEVFDYASSKPHFEKWSGDIAKATDGKSVGNVRAMHGNVAAGILKALNMDDESKSVSVEAHVVDDNEWKKVQTGTYTGFSIGGSYARKWKGDDGLQRYEAKPCEVSLVDLPCNPDAQFSVIKADGSEEMRKFETPAADPEPITKDYTAQAERLAKHADAETTCIVIRSILGQEAIAKELTEPYYAETLAKLDTLEADESIHPLVKAAVKPLADAFIAMAAEDEPEAANEDDSEAAKANEGDDLAKAGKRHSAKDQAAIDAMAKHHALAKKHVDAMGDQLANLQGGAQPDDTAEKMAKAADELQKMLAERDQLAKALETVTAAHADLLTKAAPTKIAARAVTKDADAGNAAPVRDESPVLRKDGSIDHAETALKMMKLVHRR